jgi:hypothetical protein
LEKVIIPFGEVPSKEKESEAKAIGILFEIKDKTGYDGYVPLATSFRVVRLLGI